MFQGFTPPVLVEQMRDAIHDAVGTGLIGEKVVHGPGAPEHFPESPLQDIGGPDGFPEGQGTGKIMEAVNSV